MPHKDKEERREYSKKYRLEHKEEAKESNKKYRLEHKEENKECKKNYYLQNKEKIKEKHKKYRLEHKDESKKYYLEHKEEHNRRSREYHHQHKDRISIYRKEYSRKLYLLHKDRIDIRNKEYYLKNKDKRRTVVNKHNRTWRSYRYANDPIFKRKEKIRGICKKIIIKIIKNDCITKRRDSTCLKYFGTTVDGFKKHIESQFTDTMSWYNHGHIYNPDAWQLDHIIPIGSFDFAIEENFTKAFHYTNTQPLMSSDHREKSNKEKGTK